MEPLSPSYLHLFSLSDQRGVFEHALRDVPRLEHGYCVDDVARALIVAVREPDTTADLDALIEVCLRFVVDAVSFDGGSRNRMDATGTWTDLPGVGDWWGRSLWALGTTVASPVSALARRRALRTFHLAAERRSPDLRAMSFAALGAGEVLQRYPKDVPARTLLRDAANRIMSTTSRTSWPWLEQRLTYANAVIPEALLVAGAMLGAPELTERGLSLLAFLLDLQSADGRLSVVGTDGRTIHDAGRQFDQQPIEVAALADACARAFEATGDDSWLDAVALSWEWFEGSNDADTVMFDFGTGAGYDGLRPDGRNENRGAESTLAALSTYQQARRLGVLRLVGAVA
jgi:hypothetical protein